jgi:hypothetical protein
MALDIPEQITLDITGQQIFDYVVSFLVKQGRPSVDEDSGDCLYRGKDGRMCAFGCMIPDEYYDATVEFQPAGDVIRTRLRDIHPTRTKMREYWTLMEKHQDLLEALQCDHDDAVQSMDDGEVFVNAFLANASSTASTHDLHFNEKDFHNLFCGEKNGA